MTSEFPGRRIEAAPSEARCELCGETFVPADMSDLMHFQRRDGELCGGEGVPFRKFVIRRQNRT
jgi:hypothetical protein